MFTKLRNCELWQINSNITCKPKQSFKTNAEVYLIAMVPICVEHWRCS